MDSSLINIVQVGLLICFVLSLLHLIFTVCNCVSNTTTFVNSINETITKSQFKGEPFRILKYQTIKNLKDMKKSLRISFIICLVSVMLLGFLSCQTSNNKVLEQKQKEFDTFVYDTNQKFDSLQFFFDSYEEQIDSLKFSCKFKDSLLIRSLDEIKRLGDSNKNLNNIIKHQNQIIQNLSKK